MSWVDFDGQDVTGYDQIGTDTIKYPITEDMDMDATVAELKRRCGRLAQLRLYREDDASEAG